ncbi:P1 family peptidase [Nonomuraea jiangxiensis]|uniref:D-aminopeptidase n=1 Tax=Nonomuraea jiangxiensis TaxID=633440 RepID=A0A1G9G5F6_9ACTN|nr:P1 family peptidase [Nonomuraea jiangxiensis]SDK95806.1 D-aminopeptidase [Nonomuraea jiangxiensis]
MTAPPAATRRLRDHGHVIGHFEPGPDNAITDVPSVRVGQTTVLDDTRGVYSGVTAIVPPARVVPAGFHVVNGYGKFVGATQVMELGEVETPVLLTSTLSTFRVADALLSWVLDHAAGPVTSVNPVVGEINDSWLSSVEPRPVTAEHVYAALDGARGGPVAMGNVGGGTGACALGFKAGIGTASRMVPLQDGGPVTVGVLVQANMGGELRLLGRTVTPESLGLPRPGPAGEQGSCVVVVATDAGCDARQLTRIAARGVLALGRVGAGYSHGSGDYGLAFSAGRGMLRPPDLDQVFRAVLESVEEAVIDALLAARTVRTPSGRQAVALPHEVVGSS